MIVVGGGSAGCVAAAILSEDPQCRVLLIEAGPDYPSLADLPADLRDAGMPAMSHDWGYRTEPGDDGYAIDLPRARVIGGCSSTNAGFFVRGWPQDFDGWAESGVPEWSFEALLPVFGEIEHDADFAGDGHGSSGPVPVVRDRVDDLPPLQRSFLDAAVAAGHLLVDDHNRPGAVGAGPMPRNVVDGTRMSTAITHLLPARTRSNLEVRADTLVDRVELDGTTACGVRLASGEVIAGDRIVLAGGAYASPLILMRSGIGPADQLRSHEIPVTVDLPGVGRNLADHPLVAVDLPTAARADGARFGVVVSARTTLADASRPPDVHLFAAGPWDDPSSPGGGVFGIVTGLLSPRSRGRLQLRSPDPEDPPCIDLAHLRDPHDMARMVEATRMARHISRTEPLAGLVTGDERAPGAAIADGDDEGLAASIAARVGSYHHPVGTCAMGADSNPDAVTDHRGAVRGTAGLWVIDASVMPAVPSANTNATVIAVATRMAGWLAADPGVRSS